MAGWIALLGVQCARPPEPGVPTWAPPMGVSAQPPHEARTPLKLQLCSWNLKKLGHGDNKDFGVIRAVLDENCDLAAIVEVMQRAGGHPGYEGLLARLGDEWSGAVTATPRPNTGAGYAEFYAAVWRRQKVAWCEGWRSLRYFTDNDGSPRSRGLDRFSREPAYGCFRAIARHELGFDFFLGIYHATWEKGDSAKTAAEVRNLDRVVDEMKRARAGERDVLIVGDFNLVPSKLAGVSGMKDWTEGEGSTLNARGDRTSNLYDHVLVDDLEASPELKAKARVLDVRGKSTSRRAFERTVSDHLPVVVDIEVFRSDDD
jgi:hypothetical protein